MLLLIGMKTTLATVLASLTMAGVGVASADVAPIGPDFVSAAPRAHIDRSLVTSDAMNRIDPVDVVPFQPDSIVLAEDTKVQIDAVARWLERHPSHRIVLEGHADRSGAEIYNEDLANRRISAVRDRLLFRGIASDRVVMITYGEAEAHDPLNPGDRRVVMFATRQTPRVIIAQQIAARDVMVATWTDRTSLMTVQPGQPPLEHDVVGRR